MAMEFTLTGFPVSDSNVRQHLRVEVSGRSQNQELIYTFLSVSYGRNSGRLDL